MKIAILQSNYIPWKGYFDMINMVDEFVIFDDVQYTRRDWRNRNLVKTREGIKWLTIPVNVKGNYFSKINDVTVSDNKWAVDHWRTIQQNYAKAPFFKEYKDFFEDLYLNLQEESLSKINLLFINTINRILKINTPISFSTDFPLNSGKNERLIAICKYCKADVYLSGPSAKEYIDESKFNEENIDVQWMDYSGYNEYPQLYEGFVHGVSILDLIFNTGPEVKKYMKSFVA